tara:strand:+ start:9018 stop:9650 length:633 start_codon:yes stop_codon:yes gene_type:complete
MTLTPDDLACLYVPTPADPDWIDRVEDFGGTVLREDGRGGGWALTSADRIGRGSNVVAAANLPVTDLRDLAVRSDVPGLWFEAVDEERMLALADLENEVTLLVPGRAFASGWRAGATGTIAPEFLVAPEAFASWCARFEDDLGGALDAERRMQHALESKFEPLARRADWTGIERVHACAVAGGWDGSTLHADLCDELLAFGEAFAEALGS